MKGWGKYVLGALIAALIAHAAVVLLTPNIVMGVVMGRLAQGHSNAWAHAPRVSEDSRGVVRPSPDLAYSACAFDLSHGPVHIAAHGWDDYMSLSLYAANSDNFFVLSDKESPDGFNIVLVRQGQQAPEHASQIVFSPSTRGVALVRRLAPTIERFEAADHARQEDVCSAISN